MKREDRKVNKDFLYAMGIIGAENETCDSIETPMDFAYAMGVSRYISRAPEKKAETINTVIPAKLKFI